MCGSVLILEILGEEKRQKFSKNCDLSFITDLVFVAGVKNILTTSLLAGGNLKRPEDARGKKIGVSRIGSDSHYFTIQALRRANLEPGRGYSFLQIGGDPETLTALISGNIDVACLAAPTDAQHYHPTMKAARGEPEDEGLQAILISTSR